MLLIAPEEPRQLDYIAAAQTPMTPPHILLGVGRERWSPVLMIRQHAVSHQLNASLADLARRLPLQEGYDRDLRLGCVYNCPTAHASALRPSSVRSARGFPFLRRV